MVRIENLGGLKILFMELNTSFFRSFSSKGFYGYNINQRFIFRPLHQNDNVKLRCFLE